MARGRRQPTVVDQTLMRRQATLTALTQHPSWPELEAEVNRKQERLEKVLVAKFVAGTEPVDQRQIDYLRGFIQGMRWFIAVPNMAEGSLVRYLKSQGVDLEGVET